LGYSLINSVGFWSYACATGRPKNGCGVVMAPPHTRRWSALNGPGGRRGGRLRATSWRRGRGNVIFQAARS
jgi:hypothetical protein